MKKPELPITTVSDIRLAETVSTHPAFGVATITNWTSQSPQRMFGSDLGHRSGVTLRFQDAKLYRSLSGDRHHADKILFEVDLSEAQWARLVASSGMGSGVPVTISYTRTGELEQVAPIAAPEASKKEVHGREMHKALSERLEALRALSDRLGELLEPNAAVPKGELRKIHREIARHVEQAPGSVQFIYERFSEATEQVVEDAKIEIESFVASTAKHLGMEEVRGMAPTLPAPGEAKD